MREIREILDSEALFEYKFNKKKKETKILIKAIIYLSKKIDKMRKQEEFLNELLDKREEELKEQGLN